MGDFVDDVEINKQIKKKIVVHIGYSKCGSTTLQETMSVNHGKLLEKGFLFPKLIAKNPSWLRFFWEKQLPLKYPRKIVESKKRWLIEGVKKEIKESSAENIILSDEGLVSLTRDCVIEFSNFFTEEFPGFDVTIVVIVREPVSFLTSRCQQFISDRCFDKININEYLRGEKPSNGESRADNIAMNPAWMFSRNIGNYQSEFQNIVTIKFEDAINDSVGLTSYFLRNIGCDLEVDDVRKNESRSDKSIEIISYINSRLPFMVKGKMSNLRWYGDLRALYSISGDKFRFDSAMVTFLNEVVRSELIWLKENCNVGFQGEKSINDSGIVWDDKFYNEMISVFDNVRLLEQVLVYEFIKMKSIECHDEVSKEYLRKTLQWIEESYPLRIRLNLHIYVALYKLYIPSRRVVRMIFRKLVSKAVD